MPSAHRRVRPAPVPSGCRNRGDPCGPDNRNAYARAHRARRAVPRLSVLPALAVLALVPAGCAGPRSALHPAGADAERIAALAWWLFGAAALVWIAVMGIALYAQFARRPRDPEPAARLLVVGGGVVFPVVVLAVLLGYGLWLMPRLNAPAPPGAVTVEVSGEQWWWRVRYLPPADAQPGTGAAPAATARDTADRTVELANELHLPVGERTQLRLVSGDVIHSFWVPALAGKMDMIPGRANQLVLEPTRTGEFPGACAEYCGTAHAQMGFVVVVEPRPAFERWLAAQRAPAPPPATPLAERGHEVFIASGCGACHRVRGTAAEGTIGPDLTHVGSRRTLAGGALRNGPEALRRWVGHPRGVKPGVLMPAFGLLPDADLTALAAYLEGLR